MARFVNAVAFLLFIVILSIGFSLPALAGNTIHVPAEQPTIQAGINAAINGDTVLVSPGTYFENINFNGKAITVKSAGGPAVAVIDGQQLGPVVEFATSETRNSVLRGFTLQNGNGYINNSQVGGGIDVNGASPSIIGNVIWQNSACFSGEAIASNNGSPLIQRNIIDHNFVTYYCGSGQGAITIFGASSLGDSGTLVGNLINANTSAGVYAYGSGSMLISGNIIINNAGIGFAGGGSGQLTITQNLITANQNLGAFLAPPATLVNNTVVANAYYFGSGNSASEVVLSNATDQVILDNNLIIAGGIIPAFSCQYFSSAPVMNNNDVFAASAQAYSVCPDLTGTSGNISADPIFVDLLGSNFHLQIASPAIDAGDNAAPGLPKSDFDGDSRILNNIVDIGIDEYSKHSRLTLSSYSLHYGTTAVGSISSPQIVTLTNQGIGTVTLNWIGTGTDYSETNTCGNSLTAGANCHITVTFVPIGGGIRQGALGVFTSATSNPLTVFMTGSGLAPQISLPNSFYFSQQVVGTTGVQSGTLTNNGQAPLSIHSIVLSGTDFAESNDCPIAPNTLAVNASCTVTVFYTPTIVGSETATITFNDNVLPNPQVVSVIGFSVSAGVASFSPASLTFPTTLIGQSSASQTSTLTNTGTGPLGISSIFSNGDFQETNNCPSSLATGASCTLTVTYTPSSQGAVTGYIFVYTDGATSQATFTLAGTGQAPAPTISSLSLADRPAGSPDTPGTITGTGFVYGSQVLWNGIALTSYSYTYGGTQINFTIPASYLAIPGAAEISVFTPAPGGGTSNSLPFTVYTPINYSQRSDTYSYRNITGTNLNLYYNSSATIAPPFALQFGGGSYTSLTVGAGGTISFNGFASEYNDTIPTTQAPMLIAPFWAQLYPFVNGTNNDVFWQVTGTAPNRELVVEWRNVGICCEGTNTIKFEVVFFEGNSNILFNYADTVFGGSYSSNDNGATATSGVQVAPGLGTQFSYNQPSLLSKTALLWYPSNPNATLSTSTIGFGYHQIGSSTLPQRLTLTNGGLVPLNISSLTIDNPDFTQTNTCGSTVPPGKSCTIHVTFKPTQPSAETATLTIVDNGSNSPQTVALTGIGTITSTVVYPILVNFGSVTVGSTGIAPVTLANASNKTMTIQSTTAAPSVYTETNNCGLSLAPGLSCTITVTFKPTQKVSIQGTLSMGLNGNSAKVEAKLTGSGS